MSNSTVQQQFDIHQKLKANHSHWLYLHSVEPKDECCNYQLIADLTTDEWEYALYQRRDGYFVLIDFFKNYSVACEEAKTIIDNHPKIKAAIPN